MEAGFLLSDKKVIKMEKEKTCSVRLLLEYDHV